MVREHTIGDDRGTWHSTAVRRAGRASGGGAAQDRGRIAQERERELHQAGRLDKIEGRDDLPHPVPYFRKGRQRLRAAATLQLEERERQRGDHRMMVPRTVTAALEMIRSEERRV